MIADICRMTDLYVLIVAATALEVQPVLDLLATAPPDDNLETEVLITGVGPLPATYLLAYNIANHRPDLVIQAGIAGSFNSELAGKVVVVKEEYMAGNGVWENGTFTDVFDMGFSDPDAFPYTQKWLINPYRQLLEKTGLLQVKAITVSEISTERSKISWYEQNLSPVVESMEGAALHYVCLQEKIPFLQLRAISNEVGVRDKSTWQIAGSVAALNDHLVHLLKELPHYDEADFRI